jgi:membrane fusion protein (multidrug efflux system)
MASSIQPQTEPAEAAGTRTIVVRVVVLLIVATLLVVGGKWGIAKWTFSRAHVSTDDAQVDGRIVPVLARVGGYVRFVNVHENDHVTSGQTVVQIDDVEYAQRLAQATAEQHAAEATAGTAGAVGQSQAQVATATSQRSALDAQIAAAHTALQTAKTDLARDEELASRQIIPKKQLDNARSAVETAQSTVQALERQASASDAMITNAQAGVRVAQAKLEGAKAMRDNAALAIRYTTVNAPEAGTVSRKQVEIGQLVQAGQPLMAVVADSGNWITANFKETQLAEVRVGQAVDVSVDAYDGCVATGRVQSIGAATGAKFALLPPDNATGNFTKVVQRVPVRIEVAQGCGADRPLRPGMSVTASVRTRDAK